MAPNRCEELWILFVFHIFRTVSLTPFLSRFVLHLVRRHSYQDVRLSPQQIGAFCEIIKSENFVVNEIESINCDWDGQQLPLMGVHSFHVTSSIPDKFVWTVERWQKHGFNTVEFGVSLIAASRKYLSLCAARNEKRCGKLNMKAARMGASNTNDNTFSTEFSILEIVLIELRECCSRCRFMHLSTHNSTLQMYRIFSIQGVCCNPGQNPKWKQ